MIWAKTKGYDKVVILINSAIAYDFVFFWAKLYDFVLDEADFLMAFAPA